MADYLCIRGKNPKDLYMKKSLLTAAVAVFAAIGAQAAVVLEYSISSLPGGVSSLSPSVNTVGGSSLDYTGNSDFINTSLDGAIYANNHAASPSSSANGFTFSTGSSFNVNYTGATLSFGASSIVDPYQVSLYADGDLVSTQSLPGGVGTSNAVSYDLSALGATTGSTSFKVVFSGDTSAEYGFDSYIGGVANASRNIQLDVPTTPVPEPHEYAMIAGLCLVGFAAYRRRQMAVEANQS